MKKKKSDYQKIKVIIILFILFLIISVIFLTCNPLIIAVRKLNNIYDEDKMDSNLKLPQYLNFAVGEYKGKLSTQIIAKAYNNLAQNVIPKYYKKYSQLSETDLKNMFNKEKSIIYAELGYTEYNEFELFINTIKNLKGDNLELEKYEILTNTISTDYKDLKTYIGITYKNNEEIYFNSHISNKKESNRTPIRFFTDIENEKIEENKKIESQQEELRKEKSPFTRGSAL